MARDAVAEIPAPSGPGRDAVGLIVHARQKAADAADGDAGGETGDEDEAGRAADTGGSLVNLDGENRPGERAEDRAADLVDAGRPKVQRAEAVPANDCAREKGREIGDRHRALRISGGPGDPPAIDQRRHRHRRQGGENVEDKVDGHPVAARLIQQNPLK